MANINLVEEVPDTLQQVTDFQDAREVVREQPQKTLAGVETQVYDMVSISNFLSRPYPVFYGSWKNTDSVGKIITIIDFPQELLKIPSVWAKVNNFKYIRADLKLTIRMNGTKMHYGKMAFCWLPYIEADQLYGFNNSMTSILTYPHTIVSPNEDSVIEMVLPYSAPQTYIDLDYFTQDGSLTVYPRFGSLVVMVLNPLYAGTADNDVSFNIYANFENIVLDGMGAYLTGTIWTRTYPSQYDAAAGGQIKFKDLVPIVSDLTYDITKTPFVAQGKVSIEDEAVVKSKSGVVSGTLEAVSNAGKCLMNVPLVGPYASLFSTTTSALAAIAKSMGWCKPNTVQADMNVLMKRFNFSYARGLDSSQKLAVLPDNHIVSSTARMGGHDDEMNLAFLLSTPQLLAIETITSDLSIGNIVGTSGTEYGIPVSPMVSGSTRVTVGTPFRLVYQTLQRHVCSAATYWRGSMRYCVQFTASAFHSGRFRIFYLPPDESIPKGANFVDRCNLVNMVVDLQRETEVTFTIPYMFHYPWAKQTTIMGTIYIDVMNPLTHSESPVPPVYVNVWASVGPDFQLAWPTSLPCVLSTRTGSTLSISDVTIDEGSHVRGDLEKMAKEGAHIHDEVDGFVAQGKTREETREALYPPIIPAHGFIDSGMCMGEVINTVKHFTNRSCCMGPQSLLALANTSRIYSGLSKLPGFDNTYLTTIATPGNFLNWFRYLYVFSRGSVNYKADIWRSGTIQNPIPEVMIYGKASMTRQTRNFSNGGAYDLSFDAQQATVGDGMLNIEFPVSNMLEACVPYYVQTFCVHNLVDTLGLISTRLLGGDADLSIPAFQVFTVHGSAITLSVRMMCSSGDDFEFGYIRGAPILQRYNIA